VTNARVETRLRQLGHSPVLVPHRVPGQKADFSYPLVRAARFRFRMRQMFSLLLVAATTLGVGAASGQANSDVIIHISARQTCLVGSLDVPCSDVGAKLREQGTALDAHIHLIVGADSSYQTISAALASLRDAGFRLKLGYVNRE
jgi:hypothetical protein